MYTVLLVDDEDDVTQISMKKVPWEDMGFSVVGLANNGVKALELVEEYQPDVVMTDIRMPYMDGMELSKRIRAEFPTTKILLFTGFDEFEYAKEAIHLEVDEYILKPLNCAELTKVFQKLREKIDAEGKEKCGDPAKILYGFASAPESQLLYSTHRRVADQGAD